MEEVQRVEEVTKKKFGEPFKLLIEEGSYVLDSLPPALAQMIVNETDPGRSVEFAGKLQAKLFEEGGDIKELSVLKELKIGRASCRARGEEGGVERGWRR